MSYDDWKLRSDLDELQPAMPGGQPHIDPAARAYALWRIEAERYVHAQPVERNRLGYKTHCGIRIGREQYGSRGEPRLVSTRTGDVVTCPRCVAATVKP